jgi:hypothetical protein
MTGPSDENDPEDHRDDQGPPDRHDHHDSHDHHDRHEHDDDLRALLATFAARAGDPPEHGLEAVAALRRRRVRHRRGAVATAVVLAALVVVTTWLPQRGDDDVASVAHAGSPASPRPPELPDAVELRCTPHGIDVPVATIRPRSEGLHLVVDNRLDRATEVWVRAGGWDSGRVVVEPGREELQQPVPPGMVTVGCQVGDRDEQRQVDLVDVEGIYDPPELSCPEAEQRRLTEELPVDPPTWSLASATRSALADHVREDDDIRAPGGYPDERLSGYHTTDPTARVVRDGRTVAFVHLAADSDDDPASSAEAARDSNDGDDSRAGSRTGARAGDVGRGSAPRRSTVELWTHAPLVEACASFLTEREDAGDGASVADASVPSAD